MFSNQQGRTAVKDMLEKVDDVAKQYGVQTTDNLVDQALFAEVLEEVYGTQAITSFQGEIKKAISGTARAVNILNNPITGALDIAGGVIEKIFGKSNADKIKFIEKILK
jgi:hypothetical protein